MRFYAVCTEAIQLTHRALQQLDQGRRGSRQPSRALRVATLYGHLQTRATASGDVRLALRDLAAAWNLQPRLLREDLSDLQALGWLRYRSDWQGTVIQLHQATLPCGRSAQPAKQAPAAVALSLPPSESAAGSTPEDGLIAAFAAVYNQARPQTWPVYKPSGRALAGRLQRAVHHAGGAEVFWPQLRRALQAMPEFWRTTYPQGRTGAVCVAALLSADRSSAGLGVECWHVFSWGASGDSGGNGPAVGDGEAPGAEEPDLQKARRLLYWDRDHWRGRGIEAAKLERREKQRLAELLEASGEGLSGAAAEQFSQPPRQH